MLPRARVNSPAYPQERRRGYIDPRAYDNPPFPLGHPFGNSKSAFICCSPGCFCCQVPQIAGLPSGSSTPNVTRPRGLRRNSEVKHRRHSIPSPPQNASFLTCSDQKSRSLPNQLKYPFREPISPVVAIPSRFEHKL